MLNQPYHVKQPGSITLLGKCIEWLRFMLFLKMLSQVKQQYGVFGHFGFLFGSELAYNCQQQENSNKAKYNDGKQGSKEHFKEATHIGSFSFQK